MLKTYGEPDTLIADHDLDPQVLEQKRLEQQVAAENNYGGGSGSRRANPHQQSSPYTQGSVKQRSGTPSGAVSQKGSENAAEDQDGVVAIYEEQEENTRQVVPFVAGGPARGRSKARAMQEIEKIKQVKREREEKKNAEQEKLRVLSARRRKRVKLEIEKRKVELGIPEKAQTRLALPYKEGQEQAEQARLGAFKAKKVAYIQLDEEEDRDRETVAEFMRKYQKLWRNVFAKYQNTGHKAATAQRPTFDGKSQTLTFAEITKLLKDHGTYPQLINKEEVSQMVRLVNQRSEEGRDVHSLTYAGYQTFLL